MAKLTPPPGSYATDAIPDADLLRSDVARGRRVKPENRMRAGVRLFEMACRTSRAALKRRHPDADEAELDRLFSRMLTKARRLEEHGIYTHRPMTAEEAGL